MASGSAFPLKRGKRRTMGASPTEDTTFPLFTGRLSLVLFLWLGLVLAGALAGLERLHQEKTRLALAARQVAACERELELMEELLSQTVVLAAATKDDRWETRYARNTAEQQGFLKQLEQHVTTGEQQHGLAALLDRIHTLDRQVQRSFSWVHGDQHERARLYLDSPEYVDLQHEVGVQRSALCKSFVDGYEAQIRETDQWVVRVFVLIGLALLGALLSWLGLLRRLYQRKNQLEASIKRREEAESTVRAQSVLFEQLAEHSPAALAMLDHNLNYLMASRQYKEILHLPENVVGTNYYGHFPIPEERRDAMEKVLEGIPDTHEGYRYQTSEGERWYRWQNHPWHYPDGQRGGVVMFLEEITRRKNLEKSAQLADARYRILIENLPDYIHELDMEGRVLFTNRAWQGLEIGDYYVKGIPAKELKLVKAAFKQALATLATQTLDLSLNVEARESFFRLRFTALKVDNDVKGLLLICSDITAEKRAITAMYHAQAVLERRVHDRTAELANANEEVKSFAYIISHDLRSPLVNIRGFVSELRLALETILPITKAAIPKLMEPEKEAILQAINQDIPESLSFIDSSVARMGQLVTAVLRLSRLGRKELHFEQVNVEGIVQDCLRSLAYQIDENQVTVVVGALPTVYSDSTAMLQIFSNLLTNAVTYVEPGRPGHVVVGGCREGKRIRFWVEDNGRGIAEGDIHKVFELFRRVGRQDHPGEGMGMAYVKTLVTRLGGTIECTSQLAHGTTFRFSILEPNDLPVAPEAPESSC